MTLDKTATLTEQYSNMFIERLEYLQENADESYEQYADTCILPLDAAYLIRISEIRDFAGLVARLVERSGKTLQKVLNIINKNIDEVSAQFTAIRKQIRLLIEEFG